MKKRKILILLLCFCLVLPIIASCNKDTDQNENKNDDLYEYDDLTRETAADSIPEDYDLENQTIGLFYGNHFQSSIIGDAETTDIVYSKIHERNVKVSERLNVKLDFIPSNTTYWNDVVEIMKRDISTMSDAYEILFASNNCVTEQKLFNWFHDLNDAEYINIDEPWWYKDAIMETSVDNYNYRFLYGDISIHAMGVAGTVYYNKELYQQHLSANKNPDELYNYVLDGTWTLDTFMRLTKKSHIEKGGDGSNDIYGFSLFRGGEPLHYFREASDIKIYTRNAQGIPEFDVNNDKTISYMDTMYELLWENEGAWLFLDVTDAEILHSYDFSNGKVIFYLGILNDALGEGLHETLKEGLREMKSDFGMLPYPKFDEEQEEYRSFMHNASVMVTCPVSADIDRVNEECSAVIEALASESYRSVAVPYYETALKTTYNRDDLSAQMVDIITGQHDTVKSTLTKNFAYEYSNSLNGIGKFMSIMLKDKDKNFSSNYDGLIGPAQTGLRDLIDQYKSGIM